MRSISVSLVTACVLAAPSRPAAADPPAPTALEVTSDTVTYCHALRSRLVALKPDPAAIRLAHEGVQMCDQGHVRGGIVRLRRALMIAQDPGSPED